MFIAIIDVGHGSSAVIADTGGVNIVDTGPGSALLEFLDDEGISDVNAVLISHADKDHIEGLIGLLSAGVVKVKKVCLNTDSQKSSRLWQDLLIALSIAEEQQKLQFETSLTTNHSGQFDMGDVHVQVIAPSNYLASRGPGSTDKKERPLTVHSVCAVIRLVYKGKGIVALPGDIDIVGLENLVESAKEDLHADLLAFPHHGGKPGHDNMTKFAGIVCTVFSPKSVVFSTGRGQHSTPQPAIVSAIRTALKDVRLLCTQLSMRCAENIPKAVPTHLAKSYARGRQNNKCCAGTIIIDLRTGTDIALPILKDHQAFVDKVASAPVCRG